jgi:uncharacterized protein
MKSLPRMLVGTVDAVRRYPIKSLRGDSLECARVDLGGIPGDRASALIVLGDHARAGKAFRGKEHDRLHLLREESSAVAAAKMRGVGTELRRGNHFFDGAPLSILVDRWLEPLSEHVGYAVEWERFRPNFFVRAADGFLQSESELVGSELRLGTALLRVRSPIERCVVVTYHPQGDPSDPRILRYLAERRNAWMGIYCDVVEPGSACVGNELIREAPLFS